MFPKTPLQYKGPRVKQFYMNKDLCLTIPSNIRRFEYNDKKGWVIMIRNQPHYVYDFMHNDDYRESLLFATNYSNRYKGLKYRPEPYTDPNNHLPIGKIC